MVWITITIYQAALEDAIQISGGEAVNTWLLNCHHGGAGETAMPKVVKCLVRFLQRIGMHLGLDRHTGR